MLMEGLYSLFQSCVPLNAIVNGRIYVMVLPKQYVVPAVTFSQVSSSTEYHLDRTFVETCSIDVNFWAKTYSEAAKAQDAIEFLMSMFTGVLPDGTVVLFSQVSTHSDQFEPDSLLYRCTSTLTIQHD
jgi:hypothetical protein